MLRKGEKHDNPVEGRFLLESAISVLLIISLIASDVACKAFCINWLQQFCDRKRCSRRRQEQLKFMDLL